MHVACFSICYCSYVSDNALSAHKLYVCYVCVSCVSLLVQLFGWQEDGRPSLLQRVLQHASAVQQILESVTHPKASTCPRTKLEEVEDHCSALQHWVILQGPISHETAMLLAQVVEDGNIVCSLKAEHMSLPSKTVEQARGTNPGASPNS